MIGVINQFKQLFSRPIILPGRVMKVYYVNEIEIKVGAFGMLAEETRWARVRMRYPLHQPGRPSKRAWVFSGLRLKWHQPLRPARLAPQMNPPNS